MKRLWMVLLLLGCAPALEFEGLMFNVTPLEVDIQGTPVNLAQWMDYKGNIDGSAAGFTIPSDGDWVAQANLNIRNKSTTTEIFCGAITIGGIGQLMPTCRSLAPRGAGSININTLMPNLKAGHVVSFRMYKEPASAQDYRKPRIENFTLTLLER